MGFYVQYSEEHFETILGKGSKFNEVYIPMISFCDLTIMQLSRESDHLENFGQYGIGLTKDWGINKRVSPVIYAHEKSQPTAQLYNLNLYMGRLSKFIKLADVKKELIDFFKFVKPYKGRWHRGKLIGEKKDDIIYYHEREWRYCPLLSDYKVLLRKTADHLKQKEVFNEELKKELIPFTPDDIKFIVVHKKNEYNEWVEFIRSTTLKEEDKNLLISKIISIEAIDEDF